MGEGLELGRYALHTEVASGGMASVYIGRLNGPVGFRRTVAIKRLHPHLAKDPEFVKMFLDEARLAARIQHPNVVATLDVIAQDGELFLVLDFVQGESMSAIARAVVARGEKIPTAIVTSLIVGALSGLEAVHEARDERGDALAIVHRDISPQNIMIGADGIARLLDFGVAKAQARLSSTLDGRLKGKLSYMAPEQIHGTVSRRSDIYAIGVVLWELLAGRALFTGETEMQTLALVQRGEVSPPSAFNLDVPPALDRICCKALARDPEERYASAREMAIDLDRSVETASSMRVSAWMTSVAGAVLEARAKLVSDVESGLSSTCAADVLGELEASRSAKRVASRVKSGGVGGGAPDDEASRSAKRVASRVKSGGVGGGAPDDEASRTPAVAASSPLEAATQVFATVSSVARAADQAVRGAASKVATKAARDVAALGGSALVTRSEVTAQRVLRVFAPIMRVATGKKDAPPPAEEATRTDVREPPKSEPSKQAPSKSEPPEK